MDDIVTKKCSKCGLTKELANFSPDRRLKLGVQSQCRDCRNSLDREKRAKNPQPHRDSVKRWRRNNPEKRREAARRQNKRRWENHHDELIEYAKIWRKNNPEKVKAANRKSAKKHPGKRCEYVAQRRAKKANVVGGHFTEIEWISLLEKYEHRCLCCGRDENQLREAGTRINRDHVIPLGPPHSDEISNIQPLCGECNSKKGRRTIDYRL